MAVEDLVRSTARLGHVDILQLRFPRVDRKTAVEVLVGRVRAGRATAVCFPDMSTMNIAARDQAFREVLQHRMLTLNDGAGLAWAARLRRRPLPENLNGTDLCPALLAALPAETSVYLLGARDGVAARARSVLARRFPALSFVGAHSGFLDAQTERMVMSELRRCRPDLIMVGMGNPLQIQFIDRHLDDEQLAGTTWLAVGGLLDYYGGELVRAPGWMIRMHLEWLYLVVRQPHKARRYLLGIPVFITRCLWAQLRGTHTLHKGSDR